MAEKIQVAIIAGQLVVGGAERQLYLWLSNLDRNRFEPIVLTLHPGHGDFWEGPIRALGIPLFEISAQSNKLARLLQIVRILRSYKPSLIHGWHVFSGVYASLAAKLLRTKSLAGIRSSYLPLKNALETKLIRIFCDAVVANSQAAADAYQQAQKIKKQKLFVVRNAVVSNFLDRETARKELIDNFSLPSDRLWIVSIGRMEPLKKFDTMIQLCFDLKSGGYDFHAILIGDGPEKVHLVKLVQDYNLVDQVTLTGEVPSASRWLPGFDIFCFPSIAEGSPNVIIEAGMAGLPIVAWDLTFNQEILSEPNLALLIEPANQSALLNAVIQLIKSEELRKSLGTAAQQYIGTAFGLPQYIDSMNKLYENVLAIN